MEQTDLEHDALNKKNTLHTKQDGLIAADRLRSLVQRIERLEEEKKGLADDIKDIYGEAKSAGFDVKALRAVIVLRRKQPSEVREQDSLQTLYRHALGM